MPKRLPLQFRFHDDGSIHVYIGLRCIGSLDTFDEYAKSNFENKQTRSGGVDRMCHRIAEILNLHGEELRTIYESAE